MRHLHIVSDFRAKDWRDRPALRSAFLAVAKTGASIDLARTVGESHENLAITDLGGEVRTAAVGVPLRLSATVHNFGSKVAQNVRLARPRGRNLLLRGPSRSSGSKPGKEIKRDIDVTFKKPGKHTVEVQLPEDSLPADNQRYAAVEINIANPVLIIDGNPESDDGSYVSTALAADPSITGYSTRIESPDFLRHGSLDPFRCIYLLNIPQLPADAVEILSDYVRRGGGVAWFLGDVVNTSFYNDVLYTAGGLFPVPPGANAQTGGAGRRSVAGPRPHLHQQSDVPGLFRGKIIPSSRPCESTPGFPSPTTGFATTTSRKDEVSTIASFPATSRSPSSGESARGASSRFSRRPVRNGTIGPENPSVVVFHLELVKHMAREDQTLQRRIVGEPIEVSFNPAEFLETVEITAPDANGQRVTRLTATRPTAADTPIGRKPCGRKAARRPGGRTAEAGASADLQAAPGGRPRDGHLYGDGPARHVCRPIVQGPGGRSPGTVGGVQRSAGGERSEDGDERGDPGAALERRPCADSRARRRPNGSKGTARHKRRARCCCSSLPPRCLPNRSSRTG